ncbi:hypothetical protein KFE25_009809 [Diacronema lutheri]|uniref:Beta-glucosidase n=2 Tax=Diacronema lutheri TaxID=2081491 RepID=A0A8J5X6M9_DIALT|nr:hypothetical protein KFE25_009809 [Diacronema lutheri]
MSAARGFVELQGADGWESSIAARTRTSRTSAASDSANAAATADDEPHAADGKRGDGGLCARIPPLARPAATSCAIGVVCLLAAALAPQGSLPRVVVLDCWGVWAWINILLLPLWLWHLCRVLLAGMRATARFGLARAGLAPRGPSERAEPALVFGWLPAGDAFALLVSWLLLGAVSTWAWGGRALPAGFFDTPAPPSSELIFPDNFTWGAATAAYQVEGGLNNTQWYRFEQEFTRKDGSRAIADGWECGLAADSWNRFDEDLSCMLALGIKTYRFSVEWSRIEPRRGSFNASAMARYVDWTRQLRGAGIEPLVTLHHFTEPLWRTDLGGLENASMADDFERYARYVGVALGPTVDFWVSVNEIMVVALVGWLNSEFPPGRSGDLAGTMRAIHTLVEMHRAAYRALHDVDTVAAAGGQGRPCLVSVAQNVVLWSPANTWFPTEAFVAGFYEGFYNRWVLEQLLRARAVRGGPLGARGSGLDYLGLNHYFSQVVSLGGAYMHYDRTHFAISDMDWPLDPGSLYQVVMQYHRWSPDLPILITEHGCADGQVPDARRVDFTRKSLMGLHAAVTAADVPVIGYIHWALIDNFEWAAGFTPRFGLFRVNWLGDLARSWTDGGLLYKALIAENAAVGAGSRLQMPSA